MTKKKKAKKDWSFRDIQVLAHTKSEARSVFKRLFRIPKLPAGEKVIRVS